MMICVMIGVIINPRNGDVKMIALGTIINVGAVIVGGFLGMLLHGGLKEKYKQTLMQALGLSTMFIGLSGALKGMFTIHGNMIDTQGSIILIASLVVGSLIGEWIDVIHKMQRFGEWLQVKVKAKNNDHFVEGFVTTSLVICVGAMAIVGALQDGLSGDPSMLITKSILDFVIVLIFASTLGVGTIFSAIPLGIYQGSITIFATLIAPILSETMISNLSFIGSVLIFGVGINLAFGDRVKVGNMLPSLIIVVILSLFNF